jgi:hypothetical protein
MDVRQIGFAMRQSDVEKTFETFLRWADLAKANNTESFTKQIGPDCVAEISAKDPSLIYHDRILGRADHFGRVDIEKFSELLKQFPDAKAELDQRLEKSKREAALFK